MTAENLGREGRAAGRNRSFNEAAADDRGKPAPTSGGVGAEKSFNEAAADDRGKPMANRAGKALASRASMRPRPMTAENHGCGRPCRPADRGFNEAAADDRGKPTASGGSGESMDLLQ